GEMEGEIPHKVQIEDQIGAFFRKLDEEFPLDSLRAMLADSIHVERPSNGEDEEGPTQPPIEGLNSVLEDWFDGVKADTIRALASAFFALLIASFGAHFSEWMARLGLAGQPSEAMLAKLRDIARESASSIIDKHNAFLRRRLNGAIQAGMQQGR